MSAAKVKANAPHRLIVEGRDDQWTIIELTAKHGWNWENPDSHYPYIEDAKGNTLALEALPLALRSHQRVGIVLDADIAPGDRWQSLGDRLSGTGFPLPAEPDPAGTVSEAPDGKRLGVWLMPDNQNPGKLEDFLALLVPKPTHAGTGRRRAPHARVNSAPHSHRPISSRHASIPGSPGRKSRPCPSAQRSARRHSHMTPTRLAVS